MNRSATIVLLFLLVCFPLKPLLAQDAKGEFAKAMDAYKVYDYQTSCRRLGNFYHASNGLHEIPSNVVDEMKQMGRNEAALTQTAQQAENSRESAKACSDHFLRALLLAIDDRWMEVDKATRSALEQRQKMIEALDPDAKSRSHGDSDYETHVGTASMADIVAASKAATSGQNGTCATEELMQRDPSLVRPCVHHLLTEARKQKSARQWTAAKINFKRAQQVNKILGKKQDPAVAAEVTRSVRAIEVAQAAHR